MLGIGGEVLRQDLDRDVAPELAVVRTIHLSHAASPERRQDRVRTDQTLHHRVAAGHSISASALCRQFGQEVIERHCLDVTEALTTGAQTHCRLSFGTMDDMKKALVVFGEVLGKKVAGAAWRLIASDSRTAAVYAAARDWSTCHFGTSRVLERGRGDQAPIAGLGAAGFPATESWRTRQTPRAVKIVPEFSL